MFENEHMLHTIPKYLSLKKEDVVTMKNLNEFIVSSLLNIMAPERKSSIFLSDYTYLASIPQYKFVRASTSPFVNDKSLHTNGESFW